MASHQANIELDMTCGPTRDETGASKEWPIWPGSSCQGCEPRLRIASLLGDMVLAPWQGLAPSILDMSGTPLGLAFQRCTCANPIPELRDVWWVIAMA